MKKKILVVHATYGNGHKLVANYINNYFKKQDSNLEIEVIDILDYTSGFVKCVSKKLFEKTMFAKIPIIWELIYKFYNNKYRSIGTKKMCYKLFDKDKLRKKIKEFEPDIVISTHFYASMLFAKYKKENYNSLKLYTVITDYELHEFWAKSFNEENAIIVSNNDIKKELIERQVPKNKIKVFGMPLSDNFSTNLDILKLKKKLKVDNDKKTILFFGGGNNSTSSLSFFKKLIKYSTSFNIIFIAGNNSKIKNKVNDIVKYYNRKDVKILGYVNNVYEYMNVSDLVITKPGGITISECIALKKPMIIINFNPGAEKGNYKFLVRKKYAYKTSNAYKFARFIKLLEYNPSLIDKMQKKLQKNKDNDAIAKLYDYIMKKK